MVQDHIKKAKKKKKVRNIRHNLYFFTQVQQTPSKNLF